MEQVVAKIEDINSSLSPFFVIPDYKVQYPETVVRALAELCVEYNRAFAPLVEANREWDTDYQYCLWGPGGTPVNFAVQIDMVGLLPDFLETVNEMPKEYLREILRRKIFEIENSIAMYQFLERLFSNGQDSFFKKGWRTSLDELRRRFRSPLALLAITDQKYQAMLGSEFGKIDGKFLSNAEVLDLSGFNRFFGPREFLEHLTANDGKCEYLLFVRSSDPILKLKRPEIEVEHPLLNNPKIRRVIKECALTFNIDNPEWSVGDRRRINDTKWYMPSMGMAFPFRSETELFSPDFMAHLTKGIPYMEFAESRLSPDFVSYLESFGTAPTEVESGRQPLRFKPAQGTYGCYGHIRGVLSDRKVRAKLRRELKSRGPYVAQPELSLPIYNNGQGYTCLDRVFFAYINDRPTFIGGFRSLILTNSWETQQGRNHGNKDTIWAEIL